MMKKLVSLLTALCMLLTMLPLSVMAETRTEVELEPIPVQVNPLYADVLDEQTVAQALAELPPPVSLFSVDYVSEEQAIDQLREQMKLRNPNIRVCVATTTTDPSEVIYGVFYGALEHTGDPAGGDYLAWQYGGWGIYDCWYYEDGGVMYFDICYQVYYYNDAEQEAEMNEAVDALLAQWDMDGKSDYEKICTIYEYITKNVVYDYEHLSDGNYMLMYTAYAALINGTAVCQGYANLLYRLALEVGVDCRIVVGDAGGPHAWNLVGIDGTYYYADSTWDASYGQAGWDYVYFLRGRSGFEADHFPDPYESPFLGSYPISWYDYGDSSGGEVPQPTPTPDPELLEMEWEVLALTNRERHRTGLQPLTINEMMTVAADIRAAEILEWYSHARPNGYLFATVFDDIGYDWFLAGENIAAGQDTAEQVGNYWMNDEASREMILDVEFVHVGVGSYESEEDSSGIYWTELFHTGWECSHSGLRLNTDALTVQPGTTLEEMKLWAGVTCSDCGECYLPILPEYCSGYDPNQTGVQTVTVSCLGLTDTIEITILAEEEPPAYIPGDINGDNEVNNKDATRLFQYLSRWDVEVREDALDVNGDNEVNNKDATRLFQYLSRWDVEIH